MLEVTENIKVFPFIVSVSTHDLLGMEISINDLATCKRYNTLKINIFPAIYHVIVM